MPEIIADRMTVENDQELVVFLIGMRVNKLWKVHKWLPVSLAMPRMLNELYANPDMGLLHHEQWFGRTAILVQYWRDMESLMAYARAKDAEHLPAWRDFNKSVGTNGDVGIWHETYRVPAGSYEVIYGNMPSFGLGQALGSVPVRGRRVTAGGRLGKTDGRDVSAGVEA